MIFHIHASLRTVYGPNAELYANPISPIADNIIAMVNSNIQKEETVETV